GGGDLLASNNLTDVNVTQSGTGAVARTANSKILEVVSVKDFGAVGNGVADDTAAINAALAAADAVEVPDGEYVISSTITISSEKKLVGRGSWQTTITASGTNYPVITIANGTNGAAVSGFTLDRSA